MTVTNEEPFGSKKRNWKEGDVVTMNSLVKHLSEGEHQLVGALRPDQSVRVLKECIDRGFVSVRFTETHGGTELGFSLDRKESDLSGADFARSQGVVKLVGRLTLNYTKVKCIAEINLETLNGKGHLECIPD